MSGYRSGLTGQLLDYSVKKYKGHRAIPANIFRVLGDMAANAKESKMPMTVIHTLALENERRSISSIAEL